MKRWITRTIDSFFKNSGQEPFAIRARTRFFVALMLFSTALLLLVFLVEILRWNLAALPGEAGILAFVVLLLFLVKNGKASLALDLYSVGMPVLFVTRYLGVVLAPDSSRELLYSDYLLGYATLNLVLVALTSSQVRHLVLASSFYLAAGVANSAFILAPAHPDNPAEVYGVVLVRYLILLSFLAVLLILLQRIINEAVRQSANTERRLEALVEDRTKDLRAAQERLEQARIDLAMGEKNASLERLVAGVAHEVNTPLAAIQASQDHLGHQVPAILDAWVRLAPRLESETLRVLMAMVAQAETDVTKIDFRRSREQRHRFAERLAARGVQDAEPLARTLADWGLTELEDSWIGLLTSDSSQELLERAGELIDLKRSVSVIGIAATKVGNHVDALRRYTEPGRGELPRTRVDVGRNIETVLLVYRRQLGTGIAITTDFPAEGPWVMAQPERLMQVWSNLTLNASQALKGTGAIELTAEVRSPWVEVRVRDNGPGIPGPLQPRILEPFFTTKASGGGMGLGLEIVRTIVEDHGGTLTFESQPGQTVFLVRLPAG